MFSRLIRTATTIGILCLGIAVAQADPAGAAGTIESFSTSTTATQTGGHPNLTISAAIASPGAPETAKNLVVEEPAGLSAYMFSVPRCSQEDLANLECPPASQVGLATTRALKEGNPAFLYGTAPVYAVTAGSGEYGRLAFTIPSLGFTQSLQVGYRSGEDVGMRLTVPNLPVGAPLRSLSLLLWGIPADPAHDGDRFPLGSDGCPGQPDASCNSEPTASAAALTPLIAYPGACGGSLPVSLRLETYQDPDGSSTASATLPGPTGCSFVSFNPAVSFEAGSETRSETGLDLDFSVPQEISPAFPTPPPAKSVALDFSGGLRLDRSTADAYPTCSAEQAAISVEGPGSCPAEAKVGTVRIGSPLVPEMLGAPNPHGASASSGAAHRRQAPPEITGSAYFGGLQPGGGYRVYLLGSGFGIDLKLVLVLAGDPETGALVASANLPLFPIGQISLRLSSSSGLLLTAVRCGEYAMQSTVSSWNASLGPSEATQQLILDSGPGGAPCPGPVARAQVTLSPPQLLADGKSTTTATASVLDGDGVPVPGEEVEFSSSDSGQEIGAVTDNEDGTYSAEITASTTVGTPTITATVKSAHPEVSGSAQLDQVSSVSPPAPAPPRSEPAPRVEVIPKVTIGKHPPLRTHRHRAVFTFSSDVPHSTFFCKLDGQVTYRRCPSPTTLRGLSIGRHRLSVYAVAPSGATGVPSVVRFTVLAPKRKPA